MSFKIFVLCLLILVSGTFIYIKVESLGKDDSTFNQTTRFSLGKHFWLRTLFSLHKDGDARGEYLVGNSHIIVEIVQATPDSLSDEAINKFLSAIEQTTGRQVDLFNIDTMPTGELSEKDLAEVVKTRRRHVATGQPNLFVMYADDFSSSSDEVGRTYQEYGIVLSHKRLADLTHAYPQSLPDYQTSTLLHEFGHQLGLDHNTGDNCVMNAEVESPKPAGVFGSNFTPTQFCQQELDQIAQIKSSLQ